MKKICSQYARFVSESVVEQAFSIVDQDRDGKLSYREFASMMNSANVIWTKERNGGIANTNSHEAKQS